jgi:hypothetical protein
MVGHRQIRLGRLAYFKIYRRALPLKNRGRRIEEPT